MNTNHKLIKGRFGKDEYNELVIGVGGRVEKLIYLPARQGFNCVTTLDINASHKPDVQWDLEKLPLPFDNNNFNEIHAYEVLEHTGAQGDYRFFFAQFCEFWRILKPGGYLMGSCPALSSPWLWGDPGHKRVICPGSLVFLDQDQYKHQVGKTAMSDYRFYWQGDFKVMDAREDRDTFYFMLRAIKPARL